MLNALSAVDVAMIVMALIIVRPYLVRSTTPQQPVVTPPPSPPLEGPVLLDFAARLVALETKVEGLPSLWETHEARVQEQADLARRSAARIEQAARRAEERRAERDAEPEEQLGPVAPALRELNGNGSREGVLPAVRAAVAAAPGWAPPHKRIP